MSLDRTGLTEAELNGLASLCERDPADLHDELVRHPWSLHTFLSDPQVVAAVRDPHSVSLPVSPFIVFAVLSRLAADELLDRTYVNDWIGPGTRLPVFDVEPLQEFVSAPGRVVFVARLLSSMLDPALAAVPVDGSDPWELVDWLAAVDDTDRVVLLRRLGDLALFLAGVFADAHGEDALTPLQAERIGRSLSMTGQEVLALVDPGSVAPGLDALELLGARWYTEARRAASSVPPIVDDVARRINAARRFLTHLADGYLIPLDPTALPAA